MTVRPRLACRVANVLIIVALIWLFLGRVDSNHNFQFVRLSQSASTLQSNIPLMDDDKARNERKLEQKTETHCQVNSHSILEMRALSEEISDQVFRMALVDEGSQSNIPRHGPFNTQSIPVPPLDRSRRTSTADPTAFFRKVIFTQVRWLIHCHFFKECNECTEFRCLPEMSTFAAWMFSKG